MFPVCLRLNSVLHLLESIGFAVLCQLELIYDFECIDYRIVVVKFEGVEIGETMLEECILDRFVSTSYIDSILSALVESESECNEACTLVICMCALFE